LTATIRFRCWQVWMPPPSRPATGIPTTPRPCPTGWGRASPGAQELRQRAQRASGPPPAQARPAARQGGAGRTLRPARLPRPGAPPAGRKQATSTKMYHGGARAPSAGPSIGNAYRCGRAAGAGECPRQDGHGRASRARVEGQPGYNSRSKGQPRQPRQTPAEPRQASPRKREGLAPLPRRQSLSLGLPPGLNGGTACRRWPYPGKPRQNRPLAVYPHVAASKIGLLGSNSGASCATGSR
jgi:hypothetical protein